MDTYAEQLRTAGLRVTRPRIAVLEELANNPHSSAEDVRQGVIGRLGSVSTQAIYDVLHTLTAKRLLREIEPHGSVPLYELSAEDNHHHLICRACRKIHNIPCVKGQAPCLDPDESHSFTIEEAEVVFWGVCADCRSA